MGKSWMEGEVEVYEFVTKPDMHRYVPHQFKHFIPGGDLHYTDVIVSFVFMLLHLAGMPQKPPD